MGGMGGAVNNRYITITTHDDKGIDDDADCDDLTYR